MSIISVHTLSILKVSVVKALRSIPINFIQNLAFACWRLHHAVDIAFMKSLARKQFFHCLGSEFWCQYKTVCANASAQVALSASSKARIFRKNWSTHDVFFELFSYYSNRLSKSSTWNTHPQPELKLVTAPIIGLLDKFCIARGWKTHFQSWPKLFCALQMSGKHNFGHAKHFLMEYLKNFKFRRSLDRQNIGDIWFPFREQSNQY